MPQNGINHAEPMQLNGESGKRNDCENFLQRKLKYAGSSLHVQNLCTVDKDNPSSYLDSTTGSNAVNEEEAEGRLEDRCRKFKVDNSLNEIGSVKPIPSREIDQLKYLNGEKSILNESGKEVGCDVIRIKVEEDDVELNDNKSFTDRLSRESIPFENLSKARDLSELGGEGRVEERQIKLEGRNDDLNETGNAGEILSRESNRCVDSSSGSRDLTELGEDGRSEEKFPKADVNTSRLNEEMFVSESLVMARMRKKKLENCESVGVVTSCEGGQKEPYINSNVNEFEYEDDASGIIGGFLEDDGGDDDDILILDSYEHYNGKFQNAKDHDSQVIVTLCCLFTLSTSFLFIVVPGVPNGTPVYLHFFGKEIKDQIFFPGVGNLVIGSELSKFNSFWGGLVLKHTVKRH